MKLKTKSAPLAVIAADLHLDDRQWGEICGDSKYALTQVLEIALKYHVPLVLCGDVIDVKQPSITTLTFLKQQLDKFDRRAEEQQVIYYIQGQHEFSDPTWLSLLEPKYDPPYSQYHLLKHVTGQQFNLGKYNCYALDWTPADKLEEELAKIPPNTDYLFCHQVWQQFMGNLTSPEGTLEKVKVRKAVFTGDYHKHIVKRVLNNKGKEIKVYSPGATHMRAINEPSEHYVYLLREDGTVDSIKLKSRLVTRIDATSKTSRLDLLANARRYIRRWSKQIKELGLPAELQRPLLEVRVKEYSADLSDAFHEHALLFQKLVEKKTSPENKKAVAIVNAGVNNCLSAVLPKSSASYKLVLRLLGANKKDISKVVKQLRNKYLADESCKASKHRAKKLATT